MLYKYTRLLILAAVALVSTLLPTICPAERLTKYTDTTQFTSVPFGSHSHWLQPWRAYMETVPASRFLNGTGINWNISNSASGTSPELVAAMLAKHGVRRARIEIGWSNIDFEQETNLIPRQATELRSQLLALKKYGLRPLILLNANQGIPGPVKVFSRTLTATAHVGDTRVQVDDASGLQVGYSGLSNLTDYWGAEALVTNISGNTITLSKPLPKDIAAGTLIAITTLKYRPFSVPGSSDYQATMAGWQRYVGTIAKFVAGVLGTTQSSNKGFDMEIWNEISFGSNFLYINAYYAQKPYNYDENSIYTNLVNETAAYVEAHATDFSGVQLGNGIANTIPWPASALQPAQIAALDKHPYAGRKNYPQQEPQDIRLDALGQEDKSSFIPTYSALFPEYYATALQTETLVRDMGPFTSDIYGVKHGRNARVLNGTVAPTPVWITEVNISPLEDDANITAARALAVKAKIAARYLCFYLNKGATQVDLFAAAGGDKELGIVQQSFLGYAQLPNTVYPTADTAYTSPALAIIGRIADKMSQQVDRNLISSRALKLTAVSDTHNHYQFAGDGSAAHPNLYDRDVFTFLPYQVNSRRFVIPYYVMTRDVMHDLGVERFTVQIKGVKGSGAAVSAYDPINNRTVPIVVQSQGADSLSITLPATDYPYLLTIQEAQ